MAKPVKHAKTGGFVIGGAYKGRRFRKYFGPEAKAAQRAQAGFEERRKMLDSGYPIPEGVTEEDFLLNGATNPVHKSPVVAGPPKMLVRALVDEYLKSIKPPAKAQTTLIVETVHLNNLLKFTEGKGSAHRIDQLDVKLFERYKAWRSPSVEAVTVNKELGTFQSMMKKAQSYGYVDKNPLHKVDRFKGAAQKRTFMTSKEIKAACKRTGMTEVEIKDLRRARYLIPAEVNGLVRMSEGSWLHGPLVCAAFTGMRRGEIARLAWTQVDLRTKTITAISRKQSKDRAFTNRTIEIHPGLLKVLKSILLKIGGTREVFLDNEGHPVNEHRMGRAIRGLTKDTEFAGIGWHTLRHSFASNLAAEGVDDRIIDELMGHQTKEMRRRYQHLRKEKKQRAIEKLRYK